MTLYLDTHCLVWLYYGELEKLSTAARQALEQHDLVASPMAILELELLHEIGRMRQNASTIVATLEADTGLRTCAMSFADVAVQAVKENWTRGIPSTDSSSPTLRLPARRC